MSTTRFALHAAVYLILQKNSKILLLRRYNTGWRDGMYTLPAGHIDGNETVVSTMVREAKEETGINIKPADLSVVHAVHQVGNKEYIDFYLSAKKWRGIPSIMEPNKCDRMGWFPLNKLPENLLANVKDALNKIRKGEIFSEFTWN